MAEPDAQGAARVVRIPVARPLVTAAAVVAFGAALLVGGGTQHPSAVAGRPTVPPVAAGDLKGSMADAETRVLPPDWDVTPRDLVVGDRSAQVVTVDQAVAGPARLATLAAALQPVFAEQQVARAAGGTSVPQVLWSAYRAAVSSAPRSCRLPVQLLAAIGQVESGSLAGRGLDSRHRVVPAVLGPVLDGRGFAAIPDTDGGRLDGDATWDRAVGPMQFIPSTWERWGRDGNADGTRDPQNVEDAAFSAAAYLCAGGRDLSTPAGLRSAILSYNHSEVYLDDVLGLMSTVSPGGTIPRSVVTLPAPPRPVVGPPSRPPVRAIAKPAEPSSSPEPTRTTSSPTSSSPAPTTTSSTATTTTSSSTTSGTTSPTSPSGTTTSAPAPTTTTTSSPVTTTRPGTTTTTTTTRPSPTSTTGATTSTTSAPSATSTSTACPTTSATTTSSTSATPTSATTTAATAGATAQTTSPATPSTTTSATTSPTTTTGPTTATATGTSSTTSTVPTPDPCGPTPGASADSGSDSSVAAWFGPTSWPGQSTISNLTVLVLMLASVSFTFTRVPRSWSPVAFARTAGSSS